MINNLPVIGIPGWIVGTNGFGVTLPYLDFFGQYGIVKILSMVDHVDLEIDLLVIPGGADVNPLRYGAIPLFTTSKPDLAKEYFDTVVLPKYIEAKTPVFGICRGIQSISVLFGAKLIQEMNHETNPSTDRVSPTHNLLLTDRQVETELYKIHPRDKDRPIKVNSMHHQCVSYVGFPECLQVVATYKGKKSPCVEAIRHKTLPIMAVQYHPEEMGFDILSDYMIETLISKSRNYV